MANGRHGNFVLVVPGGSSLLGVWKLLAEDRQQLDFSKWQVFWTDEHAGVPHTHDWNNYHTAWEKGNLSELVAKAHFREEQLHRICTQDAAGCILGFQQLREEAARIRGLLAAALQSRSGPDLLILGMGADCHTASILPCPASPPASLLTSPRTYEVGEYPLGSVPKSRVRICITAAAIRTARQVVLVAFGEEKASALRMICEPGADVLCRPAAIAQEVRAVLVVDRGAARELPRPLERAVGGDCHDS